MANVNPLPRARPSEWNLRDIALIIIAFVLLAGVTAIVAQRDEWEVLVGVKAPVPVPITTFTTTDFHALAFDPRDPDIVYFGHHQGVMKSTDGGRTWQPMLRQGDAMSLVATGDALVMAGHGVFMRSTSAGAVWNFIATDLPDQDIHGFAISPADPRTYFAFVVSYGLFRSSDAGATWTLVSKDLPDTVLALKVIPTTPETLYAGTIDKGLLRSVDGGKTWQSAPGYAPTMAMTLAQDPRDPRILFAGAESGLYRSNAAGSSWERIALNGKDLMTIGIGPARPERILVVDAQGRVYRSDDSGATWSGK